MVKTRDHVAAIDYSYLVLREQFLQEQYSKLQRHYAASVSVYPQINNPPAVTTLHTESPQQSSSTSQL